MEINLNPETWPAFTYACIAAALGVALIWSILRRRRVVLHRRADVTDDDWMDAIASRHKPVPDAPYGSKVPGKPDLEETADKLRDRELPVKTQDEIDLTGYYDPRIDPQKGDIVIMQGYAEAEKYWRVVSVRPEDDRVVAHVFDSMPSSDQPYEVGKFTVWGWRHAAKGAGVFAATPRNKKAINHKPSRVYYNPEALWPFFGLLEYDPRRESYWVCVCGRVGELWQPALRLVCRIEWEKWMRGATLLQQDDTDDGVGDRWAAAVRQVTDPADNVHTQTEIGRMVKPTTQQPKDVAKVLGKRGLAGPRRKKKSV